MHKSLNVLIVEDNESDGDLVVRCLKKAGYAINFERVETAEDLSASLQKNSWDLVISDYQLPNLDALGALDIFKTFNLDIPFIVISGIIGEEAAVNLIKLGVQNYVMKSNLQKLPSVIENELAEAIERREQKEIEERARLQQGSDKTSAFGEINTNFFKFNLQYLLESKSIKQSQLSRDIGISKQTISDWLKKDSLINIQQALKLTNYFKITVEELLTCNLKNTNEHGSNVTFDFLKNIETPLHIIGFDGNFTCSNQAFCDLLGFSEYDLNSRMFSELIHPEDIHHMLMQLKRAADDKRIFSQIDLRYISTKKGFRWVNSLCINSAIDKKIFIFSFPEPDEDVEDFTSELFPIEKFAIKELEKLQTTTCLSKKLDFINEIDPKTWINVDRNVFKSLIRSMFNQFQAIDFESNLKFDVLLKSRVENDKVYFCATINCAVNPKRLDLSRIQKIASMIGAEVSENYAGNIYSFYIAFSK